MNNAIEDQKDALAFILGGNADFKVHSEATGDSYLFHVWRKPGKDVKLWYVKANKVYLGFILDHEQQGLYYRGPEKYPQGLSKEQYSRLSRFITVFSWTFERLIKEELPRQVKILHLGSCSVCSRPLSDPESMKRGIGPICRKKLSI